MSQEKGSRRIARNNKYRVYNSCARKKGFTTTREATKAIHSARTKDHISLSYYHCEFCGKYHLTKKFVRSKF